MNMKNRKGGDILQKKAINSFELSAKNSIKPQRNSKYRSKVIVKYFPLGIPEELAYGK